MRTFWNKNKILGELRRMRKQHLPLYPHYVMKNHYSLFHGSLHEYGSWNEAVFAAGLRAKDFRIIQSSRRGYQPYGTDREGYMQEYGLSPDELIDEKLPRRTKLGLLRKLRDAVESRSRFRSRYAQR